jgi:hypothetical protein
VFFVLLVRLVAGLLFVPFGWLVCWWIVRLFGWLESWSVGWWVGRLAAWLVGLVARVGRSVGWLVGRLVATTAVYGLGHSWAFMTVACPSVLAAPRLLMHLFAQSLCVCLVGGSVGCWAGWFGWFSVVAG